MSSAPYLEETEPFGGAAGHWHEDRSGLRHHHAHPLPIDISHRHRGYPPEMAHTRMGPAIEEDHGAWLLWPMLAKAGLLALGVILGALAVIAYLLRRWDRLQ